MPRGGISKRQLKAIHAKLHNKGKIGFDKMTIYLMNERNDNTGQYFTEDEAKAIAGSIYQKQLANKKPIMREKK